MGKSFNLLLSLPFSRGSSGANAICSSKKLYVAGTKKVAVEKESEMDREAQAAVGHSQSPPWNSLHLDFAVVQ